MLRITFKWFTGNILCISVYSMWWIYDQQHAFMQCSRQKNIHIFHPFFSKLFLWKPIFIKTYECIMLATDICRERELLWAYNNNVANDKKVIWAGNSKFVSKCGICHLLLPLDTYTASIQLNLTLNVSEATSVHKSHWNTTLCIESYHISDIFLSPITVKCSLEKKLVTCTPSHEHVSQPENLSAWRNPVKGFRNLYYTLIYSKLTYAITASGSVSNSTTCCIESLSSKANSLIEAQNKY